MKAFSRNRTVPFLCTGVFLFVAATTSFAQQPPQSAAPTSSTFPLSQTPSSTPADVGAQIDQLIKQCNEQLNVKGQYKDAENLAKRALDLGQKAADKKRILVAFLYLGSAYYLQGRRSDALDVFHQTEALARETGNKRGLSRALNNIAGVLGDLGRSEESLSYLNQCMDVARELGDEPMQYTVLINIGQLYIRSGDPDKAEASLQESLRRARALKHSDMVSNASKVATEGSLQLLGEMEAARQNYPAALQYLQQARDSHPDSSQSMIDVLNSMAVVYQRLGEAQKAVDLLQEAIGISEKAEAKAAYPTLVGNLGEAQESLGRLDEALASEFRALAALRQSGGNPDYEWAIERRVGHIDRGLGRDQEALAHYKNSIEQLERLRNVALNTELGQASFSGRSGVVYAETADLLNDLHREPEALEIAERGRARAFLDVLAESRTGLADELSPEQRHREEGILARVSSAQKDLWKENLPSNQEKKDKADLAAAEDDLEAFHLEVRRSNPRYASIQYPEPMNVAQIQSGLLDEHTALAEFLLGEKRSLVWVVTKNGLTTAVLPRRSEIEDQVTAYRKLLTQRASALTMNQSLEDVHHLGAKLYSSLIQPIEPAIASHRSLIIVPDGVLSYLPFEALVTGSPRGASSAASPSYLVEKFAVLYGPSASALLTVQTMNRKSSTPQNMLLAFGDPILTSTPSAPPAASSRAASRSASDSEHPSSAKASSAASVASAASLADDYTERGFSFTPLPYTRDEVLVISKLFPASQREVYLGADAREETVKSAKLDDFRYIHFASHGFIDEAKPGRSGIVLSRDPKSSEDGVLQMGEIMRLKMNADLVTLSACSTGLGKLVNGEGMLGLTRAFFYSGARNLTVSLWNVNDSATAALMKTYYQNLTRGQPMSVALQHAKLSLLRASNPAWRQPYFWAPFILVGEGK